LGTPVGVVAVALFFFGALDGDGTGKKDFSNIFSKLRAIGFWAPFEAGSVLVVVTVGLSLTYGARFPALLLGTSDGVVAVALFFGALGGTILVVFPVGLSSTYGARLPALLIGTAVTMFFGALDGESGSSSDDAQR